MRPKKDPGIRREQFIEAAAALFLQHSYDEVSIRMVLEAVGDRTASPSVFYYYFADKDELYRAAVEAIANSYVGGLGKVFEDESLPLDRQLTALIGTMHQSLIQNNQLDFTDISVKNRAFVLDMKEQVTASFVRMWERFLSRSGLIQNQDPGSLALFLSGGIAAMVMDYMMQPERTEKAELRLIQEIVYYSASALGLDDLKKQQLLQSISDC